MIFPFLAYLTQGTLEGVSGGAGLVFVTLPGVFESLGVFGAIVGSFFFLLLAFAALTSTVSILEVPVAYLHEEYNVSRKKAVLWVAVVIFLLGIPSMLANGYSDFYSNFITYFGAENATDFMTFIGQVVDTWLPLGGAFLAIFAAYIWKKENLSDEVANGLNSYKGSIMEKFLNLSITIIAPVALIFLFITTLLSLFFGIQIL